jgi:hypothetical protein
MARALVASLALVATVAQVCTSSTSLYTGTVTLINGSSYDLSKLMGQVTVFLNVSSPGSKAGGEQVPEPWNLRRPRAHAPTPTPSQVASF